jgi:hypothetical protein
MSKAIEELRLLLRVLADLMRLGKILDELEDAGAELVGEVRRRRPDDRVDVVLRRLGHGSKANTKATLAAALQVARVSRASVGNDRSKRLTLNRRRI